MKRMLVCTLSALAIVACTEEGPLGPDSSALDLEASLLASGADVVVTNGNDAGAGSFRAAIEQANADETVESIGFLPRVRAVRLRGDVVFSGSQPLTINGGGVLIDGSGVDSVAFMATGGGNLALHRLSVRNAPAEGVAVEIPPTATGTIEISLTGLEIVGNGGHGVLINDQKDPSTVDGVQPDSVGSAASLVVTVSDSKFLRNGYTVSDRDGLRVNEGGPGDLSLTLARVLADENAADGVEIDERGSGDIHVRVTGTLFTRNGVFDPADLDDGFDIDEYNDGGIYGAIAFSSASNNFEEGFDFNENNPGDLRVDFTLVAAVRNGEEGIDLEEDDDFGSGGDLVSVMRGITTVANGDAADGALKIREKEAGNLDVTLTSILSTHNVGSGIFVRESSGGSSVVRIDRAISTNNRLGLLDPFSKGHGIELLESGGGDLTGAISSTAVLSNAGNGIFGDQTGAGVSGITLTDVKNLGNVLGPLGGTATFLP